jgi:hypothetical protein
LLGISIVISELLLEHRLLPIHLTVNREFVLWSTQALTKLLKPVDYRHYGSSKVESLAIQGIQEATILLFSSFAA